MYIFIVNPIAGSGKGLKMYNRIVHDKRLESIRYDTYYTEFAGHAEQLTSQLLAENDANKHKHWVVFGGDGTLHEVLNGIGTHSITLSYACGGSGNDFARGTNISFNRERMVEDIFLQPSMQPYVLGNYENRNFVNCVGFGFDAVVAHHTNRSPWKKQLNKWKLGKLIYIFQLLKQLMTYKPVELEVEVDGVVYSIQHCFLFTVNNHPYFGGGMKINPEAVNNPHEYSCIVVNEIAKWKVLFLFGTVFFGKHTKFKEVTILRGKNIHIRSKTPIIFQADGETNETTSCQINGERTTVQIVGSHMN